MKKQKIIMLLLVLALLFAPVFAEARGLVPCGGYNADGTRESACTVVDIFYMVARVTNWLIMVAGVYAVFRIIYAGFFLIISQGNQEAVTTHKGTLTNAIIGMVLVLMAFIIVNTALNGILNSKCPIDLRDPLTYLTIKSDYSNNCNNPK